MFDKRESAFTISYQSLSPSTYFYITPYQLHIMTYIYSIVLLGLISLLLHYLSYKVIKNHILFSQKRDLNICCGLTDGGGVNADIIKRGDVKNFVLLDDIYHLPFEDKQFATVLCSHTIEHVDDPQKFYEELSRVGEYVVLAVPPLWDVWAVLDIFEHKWIFLSWWQKHTTLPPFIRLPGALRVQNHRKQIIKP